LQLNEEEDSQYGSRDYAYDDFEPHMDYSNNSGKYTGECAVYCVDVC